MRQAQVREWLVVKSYLLVEGNELARERLVMLEVEL